MENFAGENLATFMLGMRFAESIPHKHLALFISLCLYIEGKVTHAKFQDFVKIFSCGKFLLYIQYIPS